MRISSNNKYKQLSNEARDQIAILCAQGYSQNNIAQMTGRNKSTLSRELKRNSAPVYEVYLPHKARQRAQERKQLAGQRERLKNSLIRKYVINRIKQGLVNGEIIEYNSKSKPYPSCLVLGWLKSGDPLHVKCSMGSKDPKLRIVTVYEPSDEEWEPDYKTRKRR